MRCCFESSRLQLNFVAHGFSPFNFDVDSAIRDYIYIEKLKRRSRRLPSPLSSVSELLKKVPWDRRGGFRIPDLYNLCICPLYTMHLSWVSIHAFIPIYPIYIQIQPLCKKQSPTQQGECTPEPYHNCTPPIKRRHGLYTGVPRRRTGACSRSSCTVSTRCHSNRSCGP